MNAYHAKLKDLPENIRKKADNERKRQNLTNRTEYLYRYFIWSESLWGVKYWKMIDGMYANKKPRPKTTSTAFQNNNS